MAVYWTTAFKVKVKAKGFNVNVYPDDIFQTTKHFIIKLGSVMHCHELEYHAKRLVCYYRVKGSYDQDMTGCI